MDTGSSVTLNTTMSDQEQAKLRMEVDTFNKSLMQNERKTSQSLGKDDFLKLLITQLSNQDPTSPMEDTEFIAQMAQFSSLEQMSNMNSNFEKMSSMLTSNQAINTIGRTVTIDAGDGSGAVTGRVEAASCGTNPQIMVGNRYYDMNKIQAVYGE